MLVQSICSMHHPTPDRFNLEYKFYKTFYLPVSPNLFKQICYLNLDVCYQLIEHIKKLSTEYFVLFKVHSVGILGVK